MADFGLDEQVANQALQIVNMMDKDTRQQFLAQYKALKDDKSRSVVLQRLVSMSPEPNNKIGSALSKAESIQNPPGAFERFRNAIPGAMQFAGGLVGGALGARAGRPNVGSAIGGAAGRGVGLVNQQFLNFVANQPSAFTDMDMAKKAFIDFRNAAATEAVVAPVSALGSKVVKGVGQGIGESLIGDRAFQRGQSRGWNKVLAKKFFQQRVPKEIAEKANKFFPKVTQVAGKRIDDAVSALDKKVSFKAIKKEIVENLDVLKNIDDIEAPNTQKKQIYKILDMVGNMSDDSVSVKDLWELRKEFDTMKYSYSFKPEAEKILNSIRSSLNNPIRNSSKTVAKYFDDYNTLKTVEKEVGRNFQTKLIDGDTSSPRLEAFARRLFNTTQDERVRQLKYLDSLLEADDRFIEDMLDMGAAEVIDKSPDFAGIFTRAIFKGMGGKKSVARIAQAAQNPFVRAPFVAAQRATPVLMTEVLNNAGEE